MQVGFIKKVSQLKIKEILKWWFGSTSVCAGGWLLGIVGMAYRVPCIWLFWNCPKRSTFGKPKKSNKMATKKKAKAKPKPKPKKRVMDKDMDKM